MIGLGAVLLLPLLYRARGGKLDPFEPLVLFAVAYGTVFVARPLLMLAESDFSYGGVDIRPTFTLVTALALVGGVAFAVGYELRPGTSLARRLPVPRRIDTRFAVNWSLALSVLAALAIGARAIGIAGGTKHAGSVVSSDYVDYVARLLVPAALCLLALALRFKSRALWLTALLVLAASFADLVPEGQRTFLLPLLGGVLVFAYIRRGRRPSVLAVLAFAVLALFASYAAVVVRDSHARTHLRSEAEKLARRPYLPVNLILRGNDAEMAPVLAGALRVVPDRTGFGWGRITFGELVARPVPRQLWPAKPRPLTERIVDLVWPNYGDTTFRPAFTPLLSFYWDFGIVGVVAGMALFGIAARALYDWFLRYQERFAAQLIFSAAVWYVVMGVRNDPVDTIVFGSFVVLPLVLMERLAGRRWPETPRGAGSSRRAAAAPVGRGPE